MMTTTDEDMEKGLYSKNLETRKRCAENSNNLTDEQIEEGLKDKSPIIRYIFASKAIRRNKLDADQMQRGLRDENDSVRALFIKSKYRFTEKECIDLKKDNSIRVKVALLNNSSFLFTKKELQELSSSPIKAIRDVVQENSEKNKDLSRYQLEKMLISQHSKIRSDLLEWDKQTTNVNCWQIERGLKDKDNKTRWNIARSKVQFNDKQVLCGLNDECRDVVSAFIDSQSSTRFLDNKRLSKIIESSSKRVRASIARKQEIKLTEAQVKLLLKDVDFGVVEAVKSRREYFNYKNMQKANSRSKATIT